MHELFRKRFARIWWREEVDEVRAIRFFQFVQVEYKVRIQTNYCNV